MIKSRVILAGALLAISGAVSAGITVTPAVVWDYDFRGLSQSAGNPALQLGATYSHDSGFYVGAWGSTIDFGPSDPNAEFDFFAGFAGGDATESFAYDVGINYYTYVSAEELNFAEVYAGITKGWFGVKLWYGWDFANVGSDAFYLETNGTFPMSSGFSLLAHVGYSTGDYWDAYDDYFDWSVGLSHGFGPVTATVKYIDGSDAAQSVELPNGVFSKDAKIWVGLQTTLPWSK
jgi:uncharacterized protein (TIGR02001 family)